MHSRMLGPGSRAGPYHKGGDVLSAVSGASADVRRLGGVEPTAGHAPGGLCAHQLKLRPRQQVTCIVYGIHARLT